MMKTFDLMREAATFTQARGHAGTRARGHAGTRARGHAKIAIATGLRLWSNAGCVVFHVWFTNEEKTDDLFIRSKRIINLIPKSRNGFLITESLNRGGLNGREIDSGIHATSTLRGIKVF
jgi:hypothetical protein